MTPNKCFPVQNSLKILSFDSRLDTLVTESVIEEPVTFFLIRLVGGGVELGPLGTAVTDLHIVACPE
jgi:hypothetical protein